MAWMVLPVSGVVERGWALSRRASEVVTRLWPSVCLLVPAAVSSIGPAYASPAPPAGTAYGIWTGAGARLTAVFGILGLDLAKNGVA